MVSKKISATKWPEEIVVIKLGSGRADSRNAATYEAESNTQIKWS
jgi:hypothetical protein